MKIKSGFSLVELLIVMAVLAILAIIMVGILNPAALVNRGKDARRKKDLARMKVALEEHFNDKGCYPTPDKLTTCGGDQTYMNPWLNPWPCDPNGRPYYIVTDGLACAKWFKILTNLENQKDADIPTGWYQEDSNMRVGGSPTTYGITEVNYGVSSTNVRWTEGYTEEICRTTQCFYLSSGNCNQALNAPQTQYLCTDPNNCYTYGDCSERCKVSSCGPYPR